MRLLVSGPLTAVPEVAHAHTCDHRCPAGRKAFFLGCVMVAGLYGAITVNRRIAVVQALPGAIALGPVLLAG